jgi:hypothetical protein
MRSMIPKGKERVFRKYPIDLMHQLKRLSIHPNWGVIDRGAADLEQLALARQTQVRVLFAPSHRS